MTLYRLPWVIWNDGAIKLEVNRWYWGRPCQSDFPKIPYFSGKFIEPQKMKTYCFVSGYSLKARSIKYEIKWIQSLLFWTNGEFRTCKSSITHNQTIDNINLLSFISIHIATRLFTIPTNLLNPGGSKQNFF